MQYDYRVLVNAQIKAHPHTLYPMPHPLTLILLLVVQSVMSLRRAGRILEKFR